MPHRLLLILLLLYIILCRLHRLTGVQVPLPIPVHSGPVKTGDLVLFSGRSLDGGLIQAWTDEIFTHIGLVYGTQYIWNSDIETEVPCILCKKCHAGPQLQNLQEKVQAASGFAYLLPMQETLYWPEEWMRELCARIGFRHNCIALAHAALPAIVPQLFTSPDEMYCTELVAATLYKATGRYYRGQATPLSIAKQFNIESLRHYSSDTITNSPVKAERKSCPELGL